MTIKSKKQLATELIQKNENLLKCPICHKKITFYSNSSLSCSNNHTFDISKRGYVNFLNNNPDIKYYANMFQARRSVFQNNFLEPVIRTVTEIINSELNTKNFNENIHIVDAGCGEGYFLQRIINKIQTDINSPVGVGFDIAKPGIDLAARDYLGLIWLVSDIASPPLESKICDVILNILSPANYKQFNRILKPGGSVVKVLPGENYLQELRNLLYPNRKEKYSNTEVMRLFEQNLQSVNNYHLNYTVQLTQQLKRDLITMTPMSWGVTSETCQQVMNFNLDKVTVDLKILWGNR